MSYSHVRVNEFLIDNKNVDVENISEYNKTTGWIFWWAEKSCPAKWKWLYRITEIALNPINCQTHLVGSLSRPCRQRRCLQSWLNECQMVIPSNWFPSCGIPFLKCWTDDEKTSGIFNRLSRLVKILLNRETFTKFNT